MWRGTDATRFYTEQDGWRGIDYGIDELLGWHVAKLGDSWAGPGADPPGCPSRLRGLPEKTSRVGSRSAVTGARSTSPLSGSTRCSGWGITISPPYVDEPQCNGVIELFMRTLKEQCLYQHRFQTLEAARRKRSPRSSTATTTNG